MPAWFAARSPRWTRGKTAIKLGQDRFKLDHPDFYGAALFT
jgi:hypothetical protein